MTFNCGYTFKNSELLKLALTHASNVGEDNERLEFLGDRILNFITAEWLCEIHPQDSEGALSKRLAGLVCKPTLAKVAADLGIAPHIQLGAGEVADGGQLKQGVLADAVEALIAAIYLDSGENMLTVRPLVRAWLEPYQNEHPPIDAKSALQEFLQGQSEPLPVYMVISEEGDAHAKTFIIRVATNAHGQAEGRGSSKKAAEQAAADALLKILKKN